MGDGHGEDRRRAHRGPVPPSRPGPFLAAKVSLNRTLARLMQSLSPGVTPHWPTVVGVRGPNLGEPRPLPPHRIASPLRSGGYRDIFTGGKWLARFAQPSQRTATPNGSFRAPRTRSDPKLASMKENP